MSKKEEAWETLVRSMRERTDSLQPPYPSFPEFMRDLLRVQSASAVAKMLGVKEEPVNRWTADGAMPGTQVRRKLTGTLGYDFGERLFYEAATVAGFPPVDAPEEIRSIRTLHALHAYLVQLFEQVRMYEFLRFVGLGTGSTLSEFLSGRLNLAPATLVKILQKLPEVPAHVSGDVLSLMTPRTVCARIAEECRMSMGLNRGEFARVLGVDHDYYTFIAAGADKADDETNKKHGYTRDPARLEGMIAQLVVLRAELAVHKAGAPDHASENGAPSAPSPPPPSGGLAAPLGDFEGLVREMFGAHSEIQTIRRDQQLLTARLDAALARLEELRQRFASDSAPFTVEPVIVTEAELGARPIPSPPVAAPVIAEEPYRSPLSPERWREHALPADAMLLRLARQQIQVTCELLGLLAEMQDDESRAAVRRELDSDTTELLIVLDAFSQAHPGTKIATLYESWRRFQRDLGVQGASPTGGNGNTKKEGT